MIKKISWALGKENYFIFNCFVYKTYLLCIDFFKQGFTLVLVSSHVYLGEKKGKHFILVSSTKPIICLIAIYFYFTVFMCLLYALHINKTANIAL